MDFKFWKKKESQIKFVVEAFKGTLERNAIYAEIEKSFDEDKTLVEAIVLGDLNKADKDFRKTIEKEIMFEIKAKDFSTCYIMTVKEDGSISKMIAVISESVSEKLIEAFNENSQVIRISR